MKPAATLAALALMLAGCGADGDPSATTSLGTVPTSVRTAPSTSAPATAPTTGIDGTVTTEPGGANSTTPAPPTTAPPTPSTTTRPRPEGEEAPDFTLALGQGGEFTLSAERKPVYMVFWAEW